MLQEKPDKEKVVRRAYFSKKDFFAYAVLLVTNN